MAARSARSSLIARARARRRSRGAAMFIVVVTLGLLAAMGVYGLSAAAYDIRAAGHVRQAAQAQHAAEAGIMLTAETLQPATAGALVRAMQADPNVGFKSSSANCKTAKPRSAGLDDAAKFRVAESCLILSPAEMENISALKPWVEPDSTLASAGGQSGVFTSKSFGDVPVYPFVRVELTNPINWESARDNAGNMVGGQSNAATIKTMVRATVLVELRPGSNVANARDANPAEVIVAGRGHLVVGPYTP